MFCVTKRELMLLAVSHVQMHCGCFGDCCVRGAETYQRAPLFLQIQHLIITHKMDPARSETDALPGHAECTIIQKNTLLGGDKPLHRFIRGQPKIIGIVLLILGSSFFILSIPLSEVGSFERFDGYIQPGFWLSPMFIVCGILYIVTEYNPTKKTAPVLILYSVIEVYTFVGVFIFITMSALAGISLRSSGSQTQVVMMQSHPPTE
ncbi:uncharacterized protein si:ch1073-291c23.2 isoform X2 [Gadus morhua]|uniref:uncharacterized protein si:ch1073-291c23.2 isoform X2 n=1 Tax=Gadus morhua TaxID=8049 RepID=UPI0011B7B838|nr:uncharacterized protein LOC115558538 isoform X2 [Gadus morhua]